MESWIAGAMAVLGTLLVLAGGTLIVLRSLGWQPGHEEKEADEEATVPGAVYGGPARFGGLVPAMARRVGDSLSRWSPASQLLGWGVVLLVLAAFVAGLMTFQLSISAGATSAGP